MKDSFLECKKATFSQLNRYNNIWMSIPFKVLI